MPVAQSFGSHFNDFESALWHGQQPRIEEFLPPGVPDLAALAELIHIELEFRLKAGEPARVEEYLARFPQLAETPQVIKDLIQTEVRFRRRLEPDITLAEYRQRFPQFAPELTSAPAATVMDSAPPPAASLAQPVTTLFPPGHEILGELGRGGMGVVYQARHLALKRLVALKMIRHGEQAGPAELQRFRRDAEALAHLQHPNIVQIHEVGAQQGQPYFSLEFCDGGSLAALLREKPLPPQEAAPLVATLARAMQYAHERGVIHRDLKPANVLLSRKSDIRNPTSGMRGSDFEPKITDFGLAKKLDDVGQTQTGAIMGTLSYMAPEQAAGRTQEIGPLADVYALGAILYECLTGRPPFQAATAFETIRQVLEDEPVSPAVLQPGTPRELETICLKCLEKQATRRYPSAADLAEDLRRFQAGEPVQARPVGLTGRLVKWVRRRPLVAALLAVAIVSLLGGSGFAVGFGLWAQENADRAREAEGEANTNAELAANNAEEANRKKEAFEKEWRRAEQEKQNAEAARAETGKERDRAEAHTYTTQVASGYSAWQAGNTSQAQTILDACRWDLRGWEHRFLATLIQGKQRTLVGHVKPVAALAYSRNGQWLASGGYDGTVRIWDSRTGQQLLQVAVYGEEPSQYVTGHVAAVVFNPEATQVISATAAVRGNRFAGDIHIWDARTGKLIRSWQAHNDAIESVAVSSDGKFLASGGGVPSKVKIWNASTGALNQDILAHPGSQVKSVAFSPDGSRVVSCGADQCARLWDAVTGKEIKVLQGHTSFVNAVDFHPDGKQVVTASNDATVRVWDLAGERLPVVLKGHNSYVQAVAFGPDGKHIVSGGDDATVKVWDVGAGRELLSLKGHTGKVLAVAFHPDGRHVATGGYDSTIKLWATEGQDHLMFRGGDFPVRSIAFSPDGTRVASDGYRHSLVKIWDPRTGKELLTISNARGPLAFSPDSRLLVGGSSEPGARDQWLRAWDASTGQTLRTMPGLTGPVTFTREGKRQIVAACGNSTRKGEVVFWDADSGEELRVLKGTGDLSRISAFSPDAVLLAQVHADRTVQVWETRTGKRLHVLTGPTKTVRCVVFSPDGKSVAAGGEDRTVRLWDTATGQLLRTLQGHQNHVYALAFTPDGRRLASSSMDSTVRLWDPMSGLETLALMGHSGAVESVAFSPDGKRLGSGGEDYAVRVWDATAEPAAFTLRGHLGFVARVDFSADGEKILVGAEHNFRLFNTPTGQETVSAELANGTWRCVALRRTDGQRLVSVREELVAAGPTSSRPATKEVVLWDLVRKQPQWTIKAPIDWVRNVAFSPDGTKLALVGGSDVYGGNDYKRGMIVMLDAQTGQELFSINGHRDVVNCVAFSPDGKSLATGGRDTMARIWDAATGKEVQTLKGHTEWVQDVTFSPDGTSLATGSYDRTIKVWDLAAGKDVTTLRGHGNVVNSVAFHPDGLRLLSGSSDRTVRIWDSKTGKELLTWRGHTAAVESVAWSPKGELALSGGYDEVVRVWRVPGTHPPPVMRDP
jgi:WD40 repeat protein